MKLGHFGIAHSAAATEVAAAGALRSGAARTGAALAAAVLLLLLGAASSCVKLSPADEGALQRSEGVGLAYNVALEQLSSHGKTDEESETASDAEAASAQSTAEAQPQTKAATAYSTSDTFKSFAWYLPEGETWTDNKADAKTFFEDVTVKFQTDKWRGADQNYFWPKKGSLSFRSYSPASISETGKASVSKDGVSLSDWKLNASTNQNIDFMVADFKSGLKANALTYGYLGVPTLFRHKLAKVTVQANTASDTSATNRVRIYKVSLKNVLTVGTYSPAQEASGTTAATAESWSCSTAEEIVLFESSEGLKLGPTAQNVTLGGNSLLVLPQILNAYDGRTAVSLYIDYSLNGTRDTADKSLAEISSYRWGIGQHINYSVVVGEELEPIEFDANVGEWTQGSSTDISIGTTE